MAEWDARFYRNNSGTWQRINLPTLNIRSVDFELLERGGYGNGKITLLAPWQSYRLMGNERVDIYLNGVFAYRGTVDLPEDHLITEEEHILNLFGTIATAARWRVRGRYAYSTYVDVSTIATDIVNDWVAVTGRLPNVVTDFQTTGVQLNQFNDCFDRSVSESMSMLMDVDPSKAIWGFDTVLQSGIYQDRIYMRPRATTVKYTFPKGSNVEDFSRPSDSGAIINKVNITGGPAPIPNLAPNGGFEHPAPPDDTHGNMIVDPSFELSLESSSPVWGLFADASVKGNPNPGGGSPSARTGNNFAAIDQNGEYIAQTFPVDYSKPLILTAWVRRGTHGTAATFQMNAIGLNASGATVVTIPCFNGNQDPYFDANAGSTGTLIFPPGIGRTYDQSVLAPANATDTFYSQAKLTVDFTAQPTVTQITVQIISQSGTNNGDGVNVDDVALYLRDSPAQNDWILKPKTNSGVVSVVWNQKGIGQADTTLPLSGNYCISLAANPTGGSYAEIRNADWIRIKLKKYTTYTLAVWVKAAPNTTVSMHMGVVLYPSAGNALGDIDSGPITQSINANGDWTRQLFTFNTGSSEYSASIYLRVYNNVKTYFDDLGLFEGVPPVEYLSSGADHAFWEGADYQRSIDVTNTSLTSLAPKLANSILDWGLREDSPRIPQVVDKTTAVAYATGLFNAKASPSRKGRLVLKSYENLIGFDGQVRVNNLPGELNMQFAQFSAGYGIIQSSSAGLVSQWNDWGPFGIAASQSSQTIQPTLVTSGRLNRYALQFNGTGNQFLATNGDIRLRPPNSYTIHVWFSKSAAPTSQMTLVGWGDATNIRSMVIDATTGNFLYSTYGGVFINSGVAVCDNNWHLLSAVVPTDGSNGVPLKLYVDGVLKQSSTTTISTTTGSAATHIGSDFNGVNGATGGTKISDVLLYAVQSDADVLDVYNKTSVGLPPPVPVGPLNPSRISYRIEDDVRVEMDLTNERPTMTLLLAAQRKEYLAGLTGPSRTGSSYSTPTNAGGATGTGAAPDSTVVHISGAAETVTSAKTFNPPDVNTTPVVVQGLASQAAAIFKAITSAGGGLTVDQLGNLVSTNPIAVSSGGTGGATAAAARSSLSAAASGSNSDITELRGTTGVVKVFVKAGTPADTDFSPAPPDGTLVVDTSANKIWARTGGLWKGILIT